MKAPEHMDSTDLCPDAGPYGIRFECSVCGREFVLRADQYDGQWDHPPGEPVCRECEEDES